MWDVQIQTDYKKEAEDDKANRCSKPESPSFFTQRIYLSSIFQGIINHTVMPLNLVHKLPELQIVFS